MRRILSAALAIFFGTTAATLSQELSDEVTPIFPEDLTPADAAIFSGATFNREIQSYFGGVSIPLLSNEKHLIMTEMNFAWTDPLDEQINIGLIHRWKFPNKDWIVGENVFFDWGNSINGNGYAGIGTGMEVLSHCFEFRFNYYWPDPRQPEIAGDFSSSSSSSTTNSLGTTSTTTPTGAETTTQIISQVQEEEEGGIVTTTVFQDTTTENFLTTTTEDFETINSFNSLYRSPIYEAAMQGYDIEFGVPAYCIFNFFMPRQTGAKVVMVEEEPLPNNCPNVWGFVGYEDFQNPFGADVAGFKGRVEWRVNPHLVIEGKYHESPWPQIGGNWYGGFRVTCNLDDPNDDRGLFARLFDIDCNTPEKSRWLQKVGRDPRYRFAESERVVEAISTTTVTPSSTVTQNPFSRVTSALREVVSIQPFN